MILNIIITLLLVFLNGFFVAAEFAIVKVRSSQIEVQADRNKRIGAIAKSIINNLDGYLAATQLGVTLASLGLGWIGEEVATEIILNLLHALNFNISAETAHSISLPLAFATITVLHIVFGELAPKSLAIRYPSNTTFAVALPLRAFYWIGRPFIFLLNGTSNVILKMFGIKPMHGTEIHTEEELRMLISESERGGAIEHSERELIQNVFDFDDRRVGNIQVSRKDITAINYAMPLEEALEFAIREGYSRYPVYNDTYDDIKGIIHTKDMMKAILEKRENQSLDPWLRKANYIPASMKIKELLKFFQKKHIQLAMVTNEVGDIDGLVTMEDILEELVGEIQDEYDNEKPYVERIEQNKYLINAHKHISDINRYLPYQIREDDKYDTLSGYISYNFEGELHIGDVINLPPYKGRILKMYRNSVEQIELIIEKEENAEEE